MQIRSESVTTSFKTSTCSDLSTKIDGAFPAMHSLYAIAKICNNFLNADLSILTDMISISFEDKKDDYIEIKQNKLYFIEGV